MPCTPSPGPMPSEAEIRDWCLAYLSRTVDNPSIAIRPRGKFCRSLVSIPRPQPISSSSSRNGWGRSWRPELVFEYPSDLGAWQSILSLMRKGRNNPDAESPAIDRDDYVAHCQR